MTHDTREVEEIQKLIATWDTKHGIGITVEQWHDLRDSVHHQLQKAREEVEKVLTEVSKLQGKFYANEVTALIDGMLKMRQQVRDNLDHSELDQDKQ